MSPTSYVHTEIAAQSSKAALEATAYGIEFPIRTMTVKFTDNYGRLNGVIFTEIIANKFSISSNINNAYISITYLPKVLSSFLCLIDGYCEGNLRYRGRYFSKIYLYLLIIALTFASTIIAHMLNSTRFMLQIIVENKIFIAGNFVIIFRQERRCIEIEISATIILIDIPAKTYQYLRQPWIAFRQIYFLTF